MRPGISQSHLTSLQAINRRECLNNSLVASLTHDIKSPLNFVASSAVRMQKMIQDRNYEIANMMANRIAESAGLICKHLENLSFFYAIQLGAAEISSQPVNIHNIVSDHSDLFQGVLSYHQNHLINQVQRQLVVSANPQILSIVLYNLIDNANKYSRNGNISITSEVTQTETRISILDQGSGMPNDVILWLTKDDRIRHKGGLGLLIVKELAKLMFVTINVEVDNGTKIILSFNHTNVNVYPISLNLLV